MSRSERITLGAIAAVALILRAFAFFHYRFDSDEPQHLHVTWGWIAGYLQYRDVFDNHTPLFHIVTAPILALVGERSDVLLYMRAPMLLLFGAVVWCTYVLARRLWSPAVGARAVVLLILFPPFFLKSLEYRNDNLWNAFWMMSLVAWPHPFVSGLLIGGALATSMKTSLMILSVAVAALLTRRTIDKKVIVQMGAGVLIIPAIVTAYFAWRGALGSMFYCVVTFNGLAGKTREMIWLPRLVVPLVAVGLYLYFRRRVRWPFLGWVLAVYMALATSYWILPLVSPRDFLTMMPLMAIFVAAGMEKLRLRVAALIAIAAICVGSLFYYANGFENRTARSITMLNQLFRLSRPGETVIDIKGELVYRPRAFYYAIENITRQLVARGIIKDTIPEDVVATRCHVAQADGPLWLPRGRAFLRAHFINLGRLRASGQWIARDGSFTIAVPGDYLVVNERGVARGRINDVEQTGARTLAMGGHRFDRGTPGERVAVLWAPAFERGFSPFHLQDLDF